MTISQTSSKHNPSPDSPVGDGNTVGLIALWAWDPVNYSNMKTLGLVTLVGEYVCDEEQKNNNTLMGPSNPLHIGDS